jgi:hypothetical protein
MSDLAELPRLWKPMEMSDLADQADTVENQEICKGFSTSIIFDGSVVSLLIVLHAYDLKNK